MSFSKVVQSQWLDMTNSRYIPRKNGQEKRCLPSGARRSIHLLGAVILFGFLLTYMWYHYQTQFPTRDTLAAFSQNSGAAQRSAEKFAIVTFETRAVTYWRESLGNKFTYVRRHG